MSNFIIKFNTPTYFTTTVTVRKHETAPPNRNMFDKTPQFSDANCQFRLGTAPQLFIPYVANERTSPAKTDAGTGAVPENARRNRSNSAERRRDEC